MPGRKRAGCSVDDESGNHDLKSTEQRLWRRTVTDSDSDVEPSGPSGELVKCSVGQYFESF